MVTIKKYTSSLTVENQKFLTEGKAAKTPWNNLSRPPFFTHLMELVPGFLFFCSHICLMHWTPARNTVLAAFALLMGKLPSQVAANLGDVRPACSNCILRALALLSEELFFFRAQVFNEPGITRSYWCRGSCSLKSPCTWGPLLLMSGQTDRMTNILLFLVVYIFGRFQPLLKLPHS